MSEGCDDNGREAASRFDIGLLIEVPFSRRVVLRMEPGFVTRGFRQTIRSTLDVRLEYLQLPVQVKVPFYLEGSVGFYFVGGPFFGLRLGDASTDVFSVLSDPRFPIYLERKDRWSRWDFGVDVGAGVEARVKQVSIFAEVHYSLGLADVYDGPLEDRIEALRIGGGVSFALRRGKPRPPY